MTPPFMVAVAFEGGLVYRDPEGRLALYRGAAEFLRAAAQAGGVVWVTSPRAVPASVVAAGHAEEWYATGRVPADVAAGWARQQEMRDALRALGVWDLVRVWEEPGAPAATVVVDARAAGPDEFARVGLELGLLVS